MRPFDTCEPLRNTNITGGAVGILCKALLEGKTLKEFGWGRHTRDAFFGDVSLRLESRQ
jgi:hypothetical protein